MALTKCPDCGTEISTEAPTCPKCGRPNAAPKKKTSPLAAGCALILVIGAAIGIFGAIFGSSDDNSSASSSAEPAAADIKPLAFTAPALYAAYARNEVATQDAIGDRPVQVTGVLASIDEDFSGSPVLHLEDGNEFEQVGLTLADSEHDKAANLRQGMRVTVICHKMVRIVGSPQGSDCYLPPRGN